MLDFTNLEAYSYEKNKKKWGGGLTDSLKSDMM